MWNDNKTLGIFKEWHLITPLPTFATYHNMGNRMEKNNWQNIWMGDLAMGKCENRQKNSCIIETNCKHSKAVLSNGWPLAVAAYSRPQPQIDCGCSHDFDQRAAAGGYAPLAAGYACGRYIKITPCFAKWLRKLMVKIGSQIYMLMVAEEEPRSEHANSELMSTNKQQDERTHT